MIIEFYIKYNKKYIIKFNKIYQNIIIYVVKRDILNNKTQEYFVSNYIF